MTSRSDLLALEMDDLTVLANRGLVRRAQQELASGLTCELDEDDVGNVEVRWSDGPLCRLPARVTLDRARCTCPATTICRHLIRSVLAYQRQHDAPTAAAPPSGDGETAVSSIGEPAPPSRSTGAMKTTDQTDAMETTDQTGAMETTAAVPAVDKAASAPRPAGEPWDPGSLGDEDLAAAVHKTVLARARALFEAGQVVEVVRSAKPSARIHTLACSVRFLVPGDPRYTHCDCAEAAPCSHVPLAVWAFRLLDPGTAGGLVSTRPAPLPVPVALLDRIEDALCALVSAGISGAPLSLPDRLRRLEQDCRADGLIWPAEVIAALVAQCVAYAQHDARFDPAHVVALMGELCVRADAIRADTGAVPALFVRGAASDRRTSVGSARLIGLGCGARIRRGGVGLDAFLQDAASGAVVAVGRDIADPPDPGAQAGAGANTPAAPVIAPPQEQPRDLWRLAQTPVVGGMTLAAVGAGQLLTRGGRRTADDHFAPGRAGVSVNPQTYHWEALRSPVLAGDIGELQARLSALPPAALRPRRVGDDVYVCPVASVDGVAYCHHEQTIVATVRDDRGTPALLVHPYLWRAREGAEALLTLLRTRPDSVRFVAGHVRTAGGQLVIAPISIVYQEGQARRMLQPWTDRNVTTGGQTGSPAGAIGPTGGPAVRSAPALSGHADPLAVYLQEGAQALGETTLLGLRRSGSTITGLWRDLWRRGNALGFARLLEPMARLATALEQKSHLLDAEWDDRDAAGALLELACLTTLAHEYVAQTAL